MVHRDADLPDISASTVDLATANEHIDGSAKPAIRHALSEIYSSSARNAEWHSRRGAYWGRLYYFFGFPAVALAALAGVTGLASTAGRIPAAIIAFAAAVFTGAATWLNSGGQRKYHQQMSAAWYSLANQAQLHQLVDIEQPGWIQQSGRETLRELLSRQAQLHEGRPVLVEATGASPDR